MASSGLAMRALLFTLLADVVTIADCTPLVMRREESASQTKIAVDVDGAAVVSTRDGLANAVETQLAEGNVNAPVIAEPPAKKVSERWVFPWRLVSAEDKCVVADTDRNLKLKKCCHSTGEFKCSDEDQKEQEFAAMNILGPNEEKGSASKQQVADSVVYKPDHENRGQELCIQFKDDLNKEDPESVVLANVDQCKEAADKRLAFRKISPECFEIGYEPPNAGEKDEKKGPKLCLGSSEPDSGGVVKMTFVGCKTSKAAQFAMQSSVTECALFPETPEKSFDASQAVKYEPKESDLNKEPKITDNGKSSEKTKEEMEAEWKKKEFNMKEEQKKAEEWAATHKPAWESYPGEYYMFKTRDNHCLGINPHNGQTIDAVSCNASDNTQHFIATPHLHKAAHGEKGEYYSNNITSLFNGKVICFNGNDIAIAASDNCEDDYHEISIEPMLLLDAPDIVSSCFHLAYDAATEQQKQALDFTKHHRCINSPQNQRGGVREMMTDASNCDLEDELSPSLFTIYGKPIGDPTEYDADILYPCHMPYASIPR